ncbi:FprA family A-type flavoprotein [Candidatus Bathyarchaeota archaeon]|nr:FprA family A-type flavoprotein [Candidatus Bathyarchaeota archaeon]
MTKVIVIYESKYGNTKRVAETIIEGINEIERIEAVLKEPKHVESTELLDYDVILIGSPNHIGGPTRGIKKFIDKLGKIELEEKMGVVFDTYMGRDFNKAVRKMEKRINEKVPGLKLITSGLSIKVGGMKGPIVEGEFPKCKEFGNKIARQMKI